MDTDCTIEVTSGKQRQTLRVLSVMTDRALVRWTNGEDLEVDLQSGELRRPPVKEVFDVDCITGQVRGALARVTPEDLPLLDALRLRPGDSLHVVSCGVTESVKVVDVLPSEGVARVFVRAEDRQSGIWVMGWRAEPESLRALRASAWLLAYAG